MVYIQGVPTNDHNNLSLDAATLFTHMYGTVSKLTFKGIKVLVIENTTFFHSRLHFL